MQARQASSRVHRRARARTLALAARCWRQCWLFSVCSSQLHLRLLFRHALSSFDDLHFDLAHRVTTPPLLVHNTLAPTMRSCFLLQYAFSLRL